jgi:sensor histidine kinase YesM
MQLSCWLFTTFFLRDPTTKYFQNPSIRFSYLALSFIICLGCTHLYAHFFLRKFRNNTKTIFFAISGVLLTGLAIFLLDYYFGFQRYRKPSQGLPLEVYDYFQFFIESTRYVGIWFLFYHLLISNSEAQFRAIALAQSETALKTAELANLKNQLNPHFLFNAINSIKALTLTDPHLARHALTELSQLLRTSLTIGNEQLVSLETEIDFVKDYLFLEKIRYEKRLNYSFDVAKETLNIKIPPMSLQLLVENAIKHSISQHKLGGEIIIKSYINHDLFVLSVMNTGQLQPVFSPKGVGLKNLEKRLQLNFKDKATFKIMEENNYVKALITLTI